MCIHLIYTGLKKKNGEQNHEDSFMEWNIYNQVPPQENVKMPTI